MMNPLESSNRFFHSRTESLWLGALIRIGFAFLYLVDRLLWTLDIDWLLSPSNGVVSYYIGRQSGGMKTTMMHTIFSLAPDSDLLFWTMHCLGILHGVLLLLGIAPRLQTLAILVNLVSFQHLCSLVIDGQDDMFRIWAFYMLFLPLDHYTIYDLFPKTGRRDVSRSWPMWPFRLFQIQITLIYTGAAFGKLFYGPHWRSGTTLWRLIHTNDFYGGIFNPDFFFNRLGPLKIITWSSLILENLCWILIWPLTTRWTILVIMVAFHISLDLAMNMHCFEWLTILGWLTFLALPAHVPPSGPRRGATSNGSSHGKREEGPIINHFVNLFLLWILLSVWAQSNAVVHLEETFPFVAHYNDLAYRINEYTGPVLYHLGIWQTVWDMFKDSFNNQNQFVAHIKYENGTEEMWLSPDWGQMKWWEKKRFQRPMDYFDYLPDENEHAAHEALCKKLAKEYGPDVISVKLELNTWAGPEEPPEDLGWWDFPAKQPMQFTGWTELFLLNINENFHPECDHWAEEGECYANAYYMWKSCTRSCQAIGHINPATVKRGERIRFHEPKYKQHHEGIVIQTETRMQNLLHLLVLEDQLAADWIDLYGKRFEVLSASSNVGKIDFAGVDGEL